MEMAVPGLGSFSVHSSSFVHSAIVAMRLLHLVLLWPAALSSCLPAFGDHYDAHGRQIDKQKVWGDIGTRFGWAAAAGAFIGGVLVDPRNKAEKAADRAVKMAQRQAREEAAQLKKNPPKAEPKKEPYRVKPDTPLDVHERNLDSKGKDEMQECILYLLARVSRLEH